MTLVYPVQSLAAHPPRLSPGYRSTVKRSPTRPLIPMRHTLSELTGPVYGHETVREHDNDLTTQHKGEPLGERITGTAMLDEEGRGIPNTLSSCGRPMPAAAISTPSTSTRRRSIRILPAPAARRRTPAATTNSLPSSPAPIPGAITTTPGVRRTSIFRCSAIPLSRAW
jgi:hypothetical protein